MDEQDEQELMEAQELELEQPTIRGDVRADEEATTPADDGLSDLFEVPKHDDLDMDVHDIVGMDVEGDVMDGDLSDLVDVSEEDVMGEDVMGLDDDLSDLFDLPGTPPSTESAPTPRFRLTPQGKRYVRPLPQPGMIEPQED